MIPVKPEITFTATTYEDYWEVLEILPPIYVGSHGFLVGEPLDHQPCRVMGIGLPRYAAYLELGTHHWVSTEPLTVPEFRSITHLDLLALITREPRHAV